MLKFPVLLFILSGFFQPGRPSVGDTIRYNYINPKYYLCHYTVAPLKMDGKLEEKDWSSVPWTDNFVDIFIGNKVPPPFNTRVKMLWDDTYFYFAAEMKETDIRAEFTKRDTVICLENDIEIFLDPNGDNHEYFEYEMNAFGTVWDLFLARAYRDSVNPDNGWNIEGLLTGISINGTLNKPGDTDKYWIAEIAIPWRAFEKNGRMPIPPKEFDQWRVNFLRVEWVPKTVDGHYETDKSKPCNNSVWSPHQSGGMHDPESFGIVQFTRQNKNNARIIPDPSLPARSALMQIYFAQKKFFSEQKRYAATLNELGLVPFRLEGTAISHTIESRPSGYIASVIVTAGDKKTVWHINEVSKIWHE
jgi:hypothetical protein